MKKIGSRGSLSALTYGWIMFQAVILFLMKGFLAVIDCFAVGSFFLQCVFLFLGCFCVSQGANGKAIPIGNVMDREFRPTWPFLYIQIHQHLVWLQRLCWHSFDYGHHENFDVEQLRPLRHMEGFLKLLHVSNMQSGLLHRVILLFQQLRHLPSHMRVTIFPSGSRTISPGKLASTRCANSPGIWASSRSSTRTTSPDIHEFSTSCCTCAIGNKQIALLTRLLYLRNMQIRILTRLLYLRNMQIRILTRLLYLCEMQIGLINRLLRLSNMQSGLLTLPRLLCLLRHATSPAICACSPSSTISKQGRRGQTHHGHNRAHHNSQNSSVPKPNRNFGSGPTWKACPVPNPWHSGPQCFAGNSQQPHAPTVVPAPQPTKSGNTEPQPAPQAGNTTPSPAPNASSQPHAARPDAKPNNPDKKHSRPTIPHHKRNNLRQHQKNCGAGILHPSTEKRTRDQNQETHLMYRNLR